MTRDDGASAVEFALVLPMLVLLLFGIIEFGLAFNARVTLTHAAREGARLASVGRFSAAAVQARALPLSGVAVNSSVVPDPAGGNTCVVTVNCPYQLVIPLWGNVQFQLTSTAMMREE